MNLSKRNLFIIGAIILALPIIYFLLWILPQQQSAAYRAKFTDEEVQKFLPEQKIQYERNVADIEDKTRLTLAQIIGGLALLSGLYFTYQNVKAAQDNAKSAQENIKVAQENLRITEEGKLTDRFSKAVELLGSENLDTRLGGIYALERIAHDSQKDHWTVMEVLTAFVREHSNYTTERPPVDVRTAIIVIGRRKWFESEKEFLNLVGVNLIRCQLIDTNLRNAYLNKANFSEARLWRTDLSGAQLQEANFEGAELIRTNLKNVRFITLEQISKAKYLEEALLSPELEKELKEWQANHPKEKARAGEDSRDDEPR